MSGCASMMISAGSGNPYSMVSGFPLSRERQRERVAEKGIAVAQESVLSAGQNPIVNDVHVIRGAVFGKHS